MAPPFLHCLAPPLRRQVLSLGPQVEIAPQTPLLNEGALATRVLLLIAGTAKVTVSLRRRGPLLLGISCRGDAVGAGVALERLPALATVTTAGPVSAVALTAPRFRELAAEVPGVALGLAHALALHARECLRGRIGIVTQDAIGRVAARLLELDGVRVRERNAVDLHVTQEELAGWAGVTRSTAARALRVLREQGLISTSRQTFVVHDVDALRERAAPAIEVVSQMRQNH